MHSSTNYYFWNISAQTVLSVLLFDILGKDLRIFQVWKQKGKDNFKY